MSQGAHAARGADGMSGGPLRMRIRPRSREVGRARRWFRACLRELPGDDAEAAEAVFAEIASNAVQHGRGRVTVTVLMLGSTVHCAVRDAGWRMPQIRPPWRADAEHGRGMMIVSALASDWGIHRHLLGKTVWFDVRVPVAPRQPATAAVMPAPVLAAPTLADAASITTGLPRLERPLS
jgi:anti-sigma regulatory factor (Ser/Thr protein kinase)